MGKRKDLKAKVYQQDSCSSPFFIVFIARNLLSDDLNATP